MLASDKRKKAYLEKLAALLRRRALLKAARASSDGTSTQEFKMDESTEFKPRLDDPVSAIPDPVFAAALEEAKRRRNFRYWFLPTTYGVGTGVLASFLAREKALPPAAWPFAFMGSAALGHLVGNVPEWLANRKGIHKSLTPDQEFMLRTWLEKHWRPETGTGGGLIGRPVSDSAKHPEIFSVRIRDVGGYHPLLASPELVRALRTAKRRTELGTALGTILGAGGGAALSTLVGPALGARWTADVLPMAVSTIGTGALGALLGRYLGKKMAPVALQSREAREIMDIMDLIPVLPKTLADYYLQEQRRMLRGK